MLEEKKGVPTLFVDPGDDCTRHDILRIFRSHFSRPAPLLNIFFFSGHGVAGSGGDDDTRGALYVGRPPDWTSLSLPALKEESAKRNIHVTGHKGQKATYMEALQREYLLTIDDLLEVWNEVRTEVVGEPKLLVVVDACYSGKWVARLRDRSKKDQKELNVGIQSAGNARQMVGQGHEGFVFSHGGQRFDFAGCLTAYLTAKQTDGSRVRWTQPNQHPQFYCTWDPSAYDKVSVNLEVGENALLRTYNHPDNR